MRGLHLHRDAGGTIHVLNPGLVATFEDCFFESDGAPGVGLCLHNEDGRCPSTDDVRYVQCADWVRRGR